MPVYLGTLALQARMGGSFRAMETAEIPGAEAPLLVGGVGPEPDVEPEVEELPSGSIVSAHVGSHQMWGSLAEATELAKPTYYKIETRIQTQGKLHVTMM